MLRSDKEAIAMLLQVIDNGSDNEETKQKLISLLLRTSYGLKFVGSDIGLIRMSHDPATMPEEILSKLLGYKPLIYILYNDAVYFIGISGRLLNLETIDFSSFADLTELFLKLKDLFPMGFNQVVFAQEAISDQLVQDELRSITETITRSEERSFLNEVPPSDLQLALKLLDHPELNNASEKHVDPSLRIDEHNDQFPVEAVIDHILLTIVSAIVVPEHMRKIDIATDALLSTYLLTYLKGKNTLLMDVALSHVNTLIRSTSPEHIPDKIKPELLIQLRYSLEQAYKENNVHIQERIMDCVDSLFEYRAKLNSCPYEVLWDWHETLEQLKKEGFDHYNLDGHIKRLHYGIKDKELDAEPVAVREAIVKQGIFASNEYSRREKKRKIEHDPSSKQGDPDNLVSQPKGPSL